MPQTFYEGLKPFDALQGSAKINIFKLIYSPCPGSGLEGLKLLGLR